MKDYLKLRQEYMKDIITLLNDDLVNKLESLYTQRDDICRQINQSIAEAEKELTAHVKENINKVMNELQQKEHDNKEHFMWILSGYRNQIMNLRQTLQYMVRQESLTIIQYELFEMYKKLLSELERKHSIKDIDK